MRIDLTAFLVAVHASVCLTDPTLMFHVGLQDIQVLQTQRTLAIQSLLIRLYTSLSHSCVAARMHSKRDLGLYKSQNVHVAQSFKLLSRSIQCSDFTITIVSDPGVGVGLSVCAHARFFLRYQGGGRS